MTDQDHQALVRRIAARGADAEVAMTQLYRDLNACVFAFVRRRLSLADDHEVQAVVVDAMYEVWRAASTFAAGSQVKTWVLGIARHKLLDSVRKNPHMAHAHDDIADHAETLADPGADLMHLLAEKQRAEWLTFCMDKLPPEQRESLHLLLVEGMSVQEISQIQCCPAGTVKTRVFHAKAKLKACLVRWLAQEAPGHDTGENAGWRAARGKTTPRENSAEVDLA